ncbi:protein NRT1/ PTR FAMILY 5.10-like isoform X1 [Salvia splendens]|nr:protein NRT1/ PTR FAMILY 5.10-like isoform X1 [Salvia splendens]
MSLSASLHNDCKTEVNASDCSPPLLEFVGFYLSLYLAAFAEGGMRPCIQAFGADQFDGNDINESKSKSSFNWWVFAMSAGALPALLILNYIQDNLSWELGFGIPCIVMFVALLLYLLGFLTYRFRLHSDEKKNQFVRISRVFMRPTRNHLVVPYAFVDAEHGRMEYLDRARTEVRSGGCCEDYIGDARALLDLLPIWGTCLGFAVVISQGSTLFTKQGQTMDREIFHGLEIPAAMLQSLVYLTILFLVPVYDRVMLPAARSLTGRPTGISMLQRIGTGLFMSLLSMVIAALVEMWRLTIAAECGMVDDVGPTLPMSVWGLAPQYVLFGLADVFVIAGLREFFYDQVPSDLKSIRLALYLSILGIGEFLISILIGLIEWMTSRGGHASWFDNNMNRGHLDYFYWLLALISALVTLFLLVASFD